MERSTIDKPASPSDAVYQYGQSQKVQSISRRFSYALIGVVTLFLFGFATIAIFLNIARIDDELEARLDNALKLAQIGLPTPLWNLDNDIVDDFVGALFLDEAIVYAKVLWGDQTITERNYGLMRPKLIKDSCTNSLAKSTSITCDASTTIKLLYSRVCNHSCRDDDLKNGRRAGEPALHSDPAFGIQS